ncbi:MAG: tRNA/rRNA methyltransferase [Marinilabiliales bacterium]
MESLNNNINIDFVLIEPKLPQNVGAAARAIKTMGFRNLVIVNGCKADDIRAKWLAVGSSDIIENTLQIDNFSEIKNQYDLIIGTSAKNRKKTYNIIQIDKLKNLIIEKQKILSRIAILFGNESYGLSNSLLSYCDIVTTIPSKTAYPSLNLAQSVMLYAYELSEIKIENTDSYNEKKSYKEIKDKISRLLSDLEIYNNTSIYNRIFEELATMNDKQINILHYICNKLTDKISNNSGKK